MKTKLFVALILVLGVFGFKGSVKAEESVSFIDKVTNKTSKIESISSKDLNDPLKLKTYTYDEILEDMLDLGLISREEFLKRSLLNKISTLSSSWDSLPIKYSKLSGDSFTCYKNGRRYVLTPYFYVGIKGMGGIPSPANYHKIVSLESPYIYTGNGSDCKFVGNIFYRLESGRSFYYGVNGDVYKTASTSISGGFRIGIGESASVSFNASYTNNFIKNIHFDDRFYSSVYYE